MEAQGASGPHWIADRLDVRLAQRRLPRAQIEGLVAALGALHAEPAHSIPSERPLAARATAARQRIEAHAPALAEAAAACEATVRAAAPALAARAARRAPTRLHGALRCERVHVDPRGRADLGPRANDACGDPAEDVAALALELAAREAADAAAAFVGAWCEASGDHALYGVLDAHLALAALEAAARTLHAAATEPDRTAARARAERLLAAPAALAAPAQPPFAIAVAGGVASGKSTLAARLAAAHAAVVVSADAARPAGLESLEPGADEAAYEELFRRAAEVVAAGRPVILDACFATRAQRQALRRWAEARGLPLLLAECRADSAIVRGRLCERARAQGREPAEWLALHKRVAQAWEPVRELPREHHVALDTTRDLEPCLERIERALFRARSGRPHRVRSRPPATSPRGAPVLAFKR